jgi:hypothetical protein
MADNGFTDHGQTHPESNIIIGGYDLEKYGQGKNFTYVDVVRLDDWGYWTVDLT